MEQHEKDLLKAMAQDNRKALKTQIFIKDCVLVLTIITIIGAIAMLSIAVMTIDALS